MHEMGLAYEIHRIARAAAESSGGGPLESVTVVVGDLSAVEPELLQYAWEAIVEGTLDRDARLVVDWRLALQECPACGPIRERAAGSWLRVCPRCDGILSISGGDELEVRQVSFAGETAASGG